MRSDPGIGSWEAEIGSADWAKRFRLAWLATKHTLRTAPERFVNYYHKAIETRAWTLMNGPDGATFKSFEAFCEAPEPWGFGEPWANIKPYLLGVLNERELDLATVAPAQSPPGKKRDTMSLNSDDKTAKRLRAINRAPEPVKELYRKGLIGQQVAAKLGPKKQTPEQAERNTRIAIELADAAKALPVKTESDIARLQREVNIKARELLGQKSDPVAAIEKQIAKLTSRQREKLFNQCKERGWL